MRIGTKILIVLVIGIVGYGIIAVATKKGTFSINFHSKDQSFVQKGIAAASSTKGSLVASATEGIKNLMTSVGNISLADQFSGIVDGGKQLLGGVAADVKDKSNDFLNNTVTGAYNSVKKSLGISGSTPSEIPQAQSITVPPSPISFLGKKGESVAFTVEEATTTKEGVFNVSIDWGDGVTEKREALTQGTPYVVTHIWQKMGDYTATFIISAGSQGKSYEARVVIQ